MELAEETDYKFVSDVIEYLIENTKFDLPDAFLQKLLQNSKENLDESLAKSEYETHEKILRGRLIRNKLLETYNLQIRVDDIKSNIKDHLKNRSIFPDLSDEALENIATQIMSNEKEVHIVSEKLIEKKLLTLFEKTITLKTQEVSGLKAFFDKAYGKDKPKKKRKKFLKLLKFMIGHNTFQTNFLAENNNE